MKFEILFILIVCILLFATIIIYKHTGDKEKIPLINSLEELEKVVPKATIQYSEPIGPERRT